MAITDLSAVPQERFKVAGRHFVSPFNFLPPVTQDFEIPTPLGLIDSTIRKVIYTTGVRPSDKDLLDICELLEELGIEEESLNMWWRSAEAPDAHEHAAVKVIAKAGFNFKVNVFTDTLLGDGTVPMTRMKQTVDMLASYGVKILNPGMQQAPTEDARKRQIDDLHAMAEYVAACGMEWNVTVAQCARRDFAGMVALTNEMIKAGVRRFDLMDSSSALSPQGMTHFVRAYRAAMVAPTPMTMHTHDDFGMATACTIAAVIAGASPDVALNGVSYRSGFAALEEVALALDVLYGVDTGIRLDRIQPAAERLAAIMGLPIPPLKPVIGSHQYLREAPEEIVKILGGQGDAEFASMGSSVAPSLTGSRFEWVWASYHSDTIIRAVAQAIGVRLSEEQIASAHTEIEAKIARHDTYPKWATQDEIAEIIRGIAVA